MPAELIILGLAMMAVTYTLVVRRQHTEITSLHRLVAPGELEVVLAEPGVYTIFLESRSRIDGREYHGLASPGDIACTLTSAEGLEIRAEEPHGTTSYAAPQYHGESIGIFRVGSSGRYTFRAAPRPGAGNIHSVVAMGKTSFDEPAAILTALGGGFCGLGIAAVGAVWIGMLILRNPAKRSSPVNVETDPESAASADPRGAGLHTLPHTSPPPRRSAFSPKRMLITGIILALFGILLAGGSVAALLVSSGRTIAGFDRVVVPGEANITIERPGDYIVFRESRSRHDGRTYSARASDHDVLVSLRDRSGDELAMDPFPGSMSYNMGGYSGETVGVFSIDTPGEYTLRAVPRDGDANVPFTVALGDDPLRVGTFFAVILTSTCGGIIAVGGFLLTGAMILMIIVRPVSSRRDVSTSAA